MAGPPFDPNAAVRFDLKSGVASDVRGARLVLVPGAALEALERTDPSAVAILGDAIGRACGTRVAARLGGDAGVRAAQLELVVAHLAGELAISGVGAVHLERWGRAMVCVVANPSVPSDAFLGAVLEGALGSASGREIAAAPLGREAESARFFLGARGTATRVRGLVAEGKSHGDALAIIQETSS
jgi:hypothetical protein